MDFTFHYVSILIAVQRSHTFQPRHLYIPLCLYFNEKFTAQSYGCIFLYIPLCLYFNLQQEQQVGERSTFTFHYVSILIALLMIHNCMSYLFTFHYVSILICLKQVKRHLNITLYIPLCLYFNPPDPVRRSRSAYFTFHYVSILINVDKKVDNVKYSLYIPLCLYFNQSGSQKILKRYLYFTFHYVSILISFGEQRTKRHFSLYIPLCLYFNRFGLVESALI